MDVDRNASGNPVTFNDGKAANFKAIIVTITPTQSGSGDPSPSNIRPISGVSSVTVTRTGKNLFDPSGILSATGWTVSGGVYSGYPGNLLSYCNAYGGAYYPYPAFKENTRYSLSADTRNDSGAHGVQISLRGAGNVNLGSFLSDSGATFTRKTVTSTAGKTVSYLGFSYATNSKSYIKNMQAEEGVSATAYEPYQGQTVTVSLVDSNSNPLTVYGGTLEVTSGTLSVTWANIASYAGETLPGRWISDRDVYASGTTPTTGAQVVYELAAPVTYNLTAAQLASLAGYNSVSADAGTLDVTYKADTAITFGG